MRKGRTSGFTDQILATAILDCLLHHATTVNIKGDSYPAAGEEKGRPARARKPKLPVELDEEEVGAEV